MVIMYRIAICDDEPIFSNYLADKVRKILTEMKIPFTITTYSSGNELLQYLSTNKYSYHIILLDILMEDLNGIEIAHKIRKTDQDTGVVFITSTEEYSLQGYEVKALRYLIKPVSETDLKKVFIDDYNNRCLNRYLLLVQGTNYKKVPLDQIISLETYGRKVAIDLIDKTIYHPGKLSDIEQDLPKNTFLRCHQSYILNIEHLMEIKQYSAVMSNNNQLPISRPYIQNIQNAFLKMLGRM